MQLLVFNIQLSIYNLRDFLKTIITNTNYRNYLNAKEMETITIMIYNPSSEHYMNIRNPQMGIIVRDDIVLVHELQN